jgi:LmbE family N-acetylglucosaminyl deacetylase
VEALVRVLRTHRPRLVVSPPTASRHPDHRQTAALVRRAHFFCAVRGFLPEVPPGDRPVRLRCLDWGAMRPSFVVDITAELPTKIAALRCYRSQVERAPGDHPTVLNDPAWVARVEISARHYGQLAGIAAGEPYAADAPLAVDDPLALFDAAAGVRP